MDQEVQFVRLEKNSNLQTRDDGYANQNDENEKMDQNCKILQTIRGKGLAGKQKLVTKFLIDI